MILIVGATGNLGSAVAKSLLSEGKAVRAMTRTPEKAEALKKLGAEVVMGDVRDRQSLDKACQGIEKIFAASHSFEGKDQSSPQVVDGQGNRNLIDAAKAAGVKHFVFTSALGARADHPVDFFRIKYQTEQYLKDSGLSYTILRPAAFMESWVEMIAQPMLTTGKATIFGSGKNPVNYVAVVDVARFALIGLENPAAQNQVIEIGGPGNYTTEQIIKMIEQTTGKTAKRSYTPIPVMKVMKVLSRPFRPVLSRMITAGINFDTTDQTFDMAETLKQYPMPLTKLEDFVRERYGKA
ncbi:MAG: SDR family oxidoreductase [candidate division KSB1 bacterium]|nr:SDR family oxidoreductase [candidate division KSB1 bacterium]